MQYQLPIYFGILLCRRFIIVAVCLAVVLALTLVIAPMANAQSTVPAPTDDNAAPHAGVIGGRVWHDLNENGMQDSHERGAANGLVKLYDGSQKLLNITLTDSLGNYRFDGLDAGTYSVEFVPPDGYQLVDAYQVAASNIDSDADPKTGLSPKIALGADASELTWDAGITSQTSRITGRVWTDLNFDGEQDSLERGFPKMKVTLYNGYRRAVQITYTDDFGDYTLEGVIPSDYTIQFELPRGFGSQQTGDNGTPLDPTGYTSPFTVLQAADQNVNVILMPAPTSLELMVEPGLAPTALDEIVEPERMRPRSYMPIFAGS